MQDTMAAALDAQSQIPAHTVAPPAAVSSSARAVLRTGANVRRCLDELMKLGLQADALALVARTLPKRYAVAWACDCLKTAFASDPQTTDVDRAGLALAQKWLADPTDENRRAAMDFAEADELGSPGAWVAASAGWCGGSLLPRGYDVVAPPDHLPSEAAVAALRLAASRGADYAGSSNAFVTRALQIFGTPSKGAGS
jgi:hypothetical protein